ncbi:hypothetical protein VPH35_112620 [Triticum aestivum]
MALDAAVADHLDRSHQPTSAQRELVAAPLMGIGHYLQLQVASTCSYRERRPAAGGGVDQKLATHGTTAYCHNSPPPTAGAAAPRAVQLCHLRPSNSTWCSSWMTPPSSTPFASFRCTRPTP